MGPGVQFDGAPVGHAPRRSLNAAKGLRRVRDDRAAYPPTIACTLLCGPYRYFKIRKPMSWQLISIYLPRASLTSFETV